VAHANSCGAEDKVQLMGRRAPRRNGTVLTIGHRGARAFAPENTLAAIEKAFDMGADMVEVDVHLSTDDELIVVHDADLTRCSDARARFPGRDSYLVDGFRAAEIAQLDAGTWFARAFENARSADVPEPIGLLTPEERALIGAPDLRRYASGHVHPPSLSQCLEIARAATRQVNVEIKAAPGPYPGIAARIARLVERMEMEDAVIVSSFDHEQLAQMRAANSRIAVGVLTRDGLRDPAAYLSRLDADAYHPGCERGDGTINATTNGGPDEEAIRRLHERGYVVHVWTVNDPAQIRALAAAGVDGIVTDFPNRVRSAAAALG
jgi:glycerophosphoryl diester phosphodiesterase